ncbi:MAG: glycosyltransferase family 4 protein [Janthinobacterium lividum]
MIPPAGDLPRIWFDVEDLFHFSLRNARPTGIQRVCFEIYQAAMADPAIAKRVGFLRHSTTERGFIEADWIELEAQFRRITERSGPSEPARLRPENVRKYVPEGIAEAALAPVPAAVPDAGLSQPAGSSHRRRPVTLLRRVLRLFPERLVRPAILFTVMQGQAGVALSSATGLTVAALIRRGADGGTRRLIRMKAILPRPAMPAALMQTVRSRPGHVPPDRPAEQKPMRRLADIVRRGDILAVLGSPWFELEYAELVGHASGRLGMRIAVLLYDVIPVQRPEWADRGTTRVYRNWYTTVLPLADVVFAISRATATDVTKWCGRDGIILRNPVRALTLGTGFGNTVADRASVPGTAASIPSSLLTVLEGRPYVLFVSTIEARKNHMLLFRAWRRLTEEMAPGQLPDLVFAGKVGWMVSDLMNQIENSSSLNGRLHVIEGLDDHELKAVYAGCLFTVFPSFYEGWGLPVSESLAMGKPCISSNATSLPEAGGTLARYFDPTDLNDACRVIRATIEDKAGLSDWQDEIRRSFQPVAWQATASAVVAILDERV